MHRVRSNPVCYIDNHQLSQAFLFSWLLDIKSRFKKSSRKRKKKNVLRSQNKQRTSCCESLFLHRCAPIILKTSSKFRVCRPLCCLYKDEYIIIHYSDYISCICSVCTCSRRTSRTQCDQAAAECILYKQRRKNSEKNE